MSAFDGNTFTCPDCGRVEELTMKLTPEFPSIFYFRRHDDSVCCLKCAKRKDGFVNLYSPARQAHAENLRYELALSTVPASKVAIHRMMDTPERFEQWMKDFERELEFDRMVILDSLGGSVSKHKEG